MVQVAGISVLESHLGNIDILSGHAIFGLIFIFFIIKSRHVDGVWGTTRFTRIHYSLHTVYGFEVLLEAD